MDAFARECFKLGTLRGFKHFKAELRGREEMMLAIEVPSDSRAPQLLVPMVLTEARPPASPCQHETGRGNTPWSSALLASPTRRSEPPQSCSFLIAGYAHYNCPLAWVRSGHHLLGANFASPATRDAPVQLTAAVAWSQRTVHAFEFVAELVMALVHPQPTNPFALDTSFLQNLPQVDQMLLSGSLASFLRDVHTHMPQYAPQVEADMQRLLSAHYTSLPSTLGALHPQPQNGDQGSTNGANGNGMVVRPSPLGGRARSY